MGGARKILPVLWLYFEQNLRLESSKFQLSNSFLTFFEAQKRNSRIIVFIEHTLNHRFAVVDALIEPLNSPDIITKYNQYATAKLAYVIDNTITKDYKSLYFKALKKDQKQIYLYSMTFGQY